MASACINSSPAPLILLDPKPDPISASVSDPGPKPGPDKDLIIDFEFRLHDDPVKMLTADQLFSDGKLVPLQMTASLASSPPPIIGSLADPVSTATLRSEIAAAASSPNTPKCSSRWREILGLRKKQPDPNPNLNTRSIKNLLLYRNPNPRSEPLISLPLLRDSDSDSISFSSSRHSLSSSSSSSDSSDLPRLSLDTDRSSLNRTGSGANPMRRPVTRAAAGEAESPRMNASGKVVFYSRSLERSSSSPGSFNGGGRGRVRARGMERSFSANVVRVNPVLNVPVCSLRRRNSGSIFGVFSGQKKEKSCVGGKGKSERRSRD